MREPNEFLGREGHAIFALRHAKSEPQLVLGPTSCVGPALETKTALNGDAVIRRLALTVARPSWIDGRTEKICALDDGRADRCYAERQSLADGIARRGGNETPLKVSGEHDDGLPSIAKK
jgi:hypothetical protein